MNVGLLDDGLDLNPEQPEALMYVPGPNGQRILGGVEYIVPAADWDAANGPPMLLGQTFNLNTELELYALHAWVFKNNPAGMFEDWNPKVTCP